MDDTDERPPYWKRCEEMGYAQLDRFIHDALERLSRSSISDNEELPRSREDYVALCDMLSAKADALKEDTPVPKRPTYEGPSDPGYFFTPSDELDALYDQLRQAESRVDYETEHGGGGVYLEYIKGELQAVEQKIAPVERREKQEYNEHLRDYREAYEPYRQRLRSWRAQVEKAERMREVESKREEAVRRAYRKVERAFGPKRISTLPWDFAAPGERTDDQVVYGYYREVLDRGQLENFDQERLDKILSLPRNGLLKGKAGFYGYIVLLFAHTDKALMECPVYANAIYVLDSSEERLLRMNKQELLASGEAKRIFHTGDWYQRVKQEFGIE